jgi:putative chitinase
MATEKRPAKERAHKARSFLLLCGGHALNEEIELTQAQLQSTMRQAHPATLARYLQPLRNSMAKHEITNTLRVAHFLAQVAHESGQLAFPEELASGDAYEGRADLGNTQPGDGPRFKGRGLLQITGRSAYTAFAQFLHQPALLTDAGARSVATDASLAVESAAWFWSTHKLNQLADADNIVAITRVINGGLNGRSGREKFLAQAKAALAVPGELPQVHGMEQQAEAA